MSKLKHIGKKVIKGIVLAYYRLMILLCPVNAKVIVFESNLGRNYTGNPRSIYEEMVGLGLDKSYRCYFILEDLRVQIPGNSKKVKRNRFYYFYILAIAGIIVSDSRIPMYIVKRKKTTYIQTWHGTPLKKLALDMEEVSMAGESSIELYKQNFEKNTSRWDYLISQNQYSSEIFRRAFRFHKEILEIGYPRNDVLFQKNDVASIVELKKELKLPLDKKIILYAPTWRDDEYYGLGKYKFTSKLDFQLAKEQLGQEYVFIVKYHYLVQEQIDWSEYKGFVYEFDQTYDISTLYLVADMLITDYSSVMFDYSILSRPMFFFAYDLEKYKNQLRGFYFDIMTEVPGPIVTTTAELLNEIQNYKPEAYKDKYEAFQLKFNHADCGMASRRVVELIQKLS